MRTLTSGTLNVLAYDYAVWKQERNVLRVTDNNATIARLCSPTMNDELAQYTLDANHTVEIDLSDFIRAHATQRNVYIRTGASQSVNASYSVVGLINPENVLIPYNKHVNELKELARTVGDNSNIINIVPPACLYSGIVPIVAEFARIDDAFIQDVQLYFQTMGVGTVTTTEKAITIPIGITRVRTTNNYEEDRELPLMIIKPRECGKTYAAVRWVSFTGVTRCHTWEVVQKKTETDGAFELLTQDGAFNVVKGREDGFTLRLYGLNAYDVWYYSDVCHSSRVEVSFDGVKWQSVNVATKGVTIPDGDAGKTNTLLVELIYKKYDAISM